MFIVFNKGHCVYKIISYILLSLSSLTVTASDYEAKDIEDYTQLTLPNGFRVILNSRGVSQTASLRLNVRVGSSNFSCEKYETPHYLEHMLFDGTKSMSREKIKQTFDANGIIWNASTAGEYTNYKLDVYSPRIKTAINVLFDMIANSTLPNERFIQTRDIINSEISPPPSFIKRIIDTGIGRDAQTKALATILPKSAYRCFGGHTATNITIRELWEAYRKYYVPQNMTFILVGNFNVEEVKTLIIKTFGTLKKTEFVTNLYQFKMLDGNDPLYTGTMNPLISNETFVGYAYAIPSLDNTDYIPLKFLENFLYERLFKILRMEHGITYAPTADIYSRERHAVFIIGADVEHKNVELVKSLLLKELDNLKAGNVDLDYFNKTKQSLLISLVHGYESNEDYTSTYEGSLSEFDVFNRLLSNEEVYTEMTPEKMAVLANKYFIDSNRIRMVGTPSLSSLQAIGILVAIVLSLMYPFFKFFSHKLKRFKNRRSTFKV